MAELSKRQRRIAAERELKKGDSVLKEIDFSGMKNKPSFMTRCWRNNRYIVMIDDNRMTTHGKAILALVQKHDDTPILHHWSEMQKIKNTIFGEQSTAIEYYPPESELQDIHNIYWMWVFPDGVIPKPLL